MNMLSEYSSIIEIIDIMNKLGYREEDVRELIKFYLQRDIIESPFYEGPDNDSSEIRTLRISKLGKYYLNVFIYKDAYIEECKNASYVDEEYYELLIENYCNGKDILNDKKTRIIARLESTSLFLEYLSSKEKEEEEQIFERNVDKKIEYIYRQMIGLISKIENKYKEVRKKIQYSLDSHFA